MKFKINWNNKFNCLVFTKLTLSQFYHVGDKIEVYLNDQKQFNAKVVGKKKMTLTQVNNYIAGVDMGCCAEEGRRIIQKVYEGKHIDWAVQDIYLYLVKREA